MKMVIKMLCKSVLIQYPFSHLIENDGVGYLVAEALRHRDVALGGVEVGRRRRPHDLCAERPQRVHLQGCQMAKFDPFLSLDCARVEGVGAQSKERKGSNFAA